MQRTSAGSPRGLEIPDHVGAVFVETVFEGGSSLEPRTSWNAYEADFFPVRWHDTLVDDPLTGFAWPTATKRQGTPAYMAPEVWQKEAHARTQADMWAFGV